MIKDLYTDTSSKILLNRSTGLVTDPVPVGRGTIQGDTLSPLLFLIYLEPLLRWLSVGARGYTPGCTAPLGHHPARCTQTAGAYADDLDLTASDLGSLGVQFDKLLQYCLWGELALNAAKCRVSGVLHRHATTWLAATPHDNAMHAYARTPARRQVLRPL